MNIEGRVVIITGATGVMGRTAAKQFADRGARLVLVGTNPEKLQQLALELGLPDERIMLHAADLIQPAAAYAITEQSLERFGKIDILLHLVGGWSGGKPVIEVNENDLESMLQQHLWTTYHLAQAIIPVMSNHHWGRILVISSPLASRPTANMAPYVIGKAAQEALMLTIAQEVKESGITANMLLVKAIDTKHLRDEQPSPKNASWTTPDEITATLLHLCSDDAGMISGARIPLYGSA